MSLAFMGPKTPPEKKAPLSSIGKPERNRVLTRAGKTIRSPA
jgi:hypothetical protein